MSSFTNFLKNLIKLKIFSNFSRVRLFRFDYYKSQEITAATLGDEWKQQKYSWRQFGRPSSRFPGKNIWITFWVTKRNIVFFRWTLDFIRPERFKLRGPYMLDGQPWPHACYLRWQSIPFRSSWDTPLFSKWLEDGAFEAMFSNSPWGIFKGWTNVGRQRRRDSNFYRSKSVIFSHMYEF